MTVAMTYSSSREEILMSRRKAMKLASRGKRFGAACIDMIIPSVSCFIAFIAVIILIANDFAYNSYGYGFGYGYGYGYNSGPSAGTVTALIISMILNIAYIVIQIFFYNKSKTMGKAALGLQVVSSKDGEPIGFWLMLFREWFVKAASGSVFCLGFIWILIDDRNRGWHDKILDTYVVDLKESAALYTADAPGTAAVRPAEAEETMQRPSPKSAPVPAVSPVNGNAVSQVSEAAAEPVTVTEQPAVVELPDSVLEVADVVVETAKHAAADAADGTEYDTVNARTDEVDEQK